MDISITPKKWVGGVCIHDNKILLIHRINKSLLTTKEYFVFPGSTAHEDESLETAIMREFKENSILVRVENLLYSTEGVHEEEPEYYYTCEYLLGDHELHITHRLDEPCEEGKCSQFFTPMWIPVNELDDLIVYPESVKALVLESMEEEGD